MKFAKVQLKEITGCLFLCLILAVTVCGQPQGKDFTPVENPLDVFKMIGNQSKSNYEKIKTWQGEYEIEETNYSGKIAEDFAKSIEAVLPPDFCIVQKGMFRFFIDIRKDCLFVDYKQDAVSINEVSGTPIVLNKKSQKLLKDNYLKHQITVINPKEVLTFEKKELLASFPELGDRDDRVGRVAFRRIRTPYAVKTIANFVDPRSFFTFGDNQFWDFCLKVSSKERPLYVKSETNESRVYLRRSANGNQNRYQIYLDFVGRSNLVFEYIVDGSASFNVTFYANGHGSVEKGYVPITKQHCEYSKISDIFLPSVFEYSVGETKYPNVLMLTRKLKLLNAVVNQPVPKELFNIESLGLDDGDRLKDEIKNQLFELVDKEIVPVNSVKKNSGNRQGVATVARLIFIVVGIVLIVIGTVLKVRNKMRHR
ncbi:MAG: hypothetical protein LBJ00_03500 [Planctomycetaceae bacterium]|jgi:hypothetical protein|nr:hypothetical protein [Planctomycetaceae bacterium]